MKIYRILLLIAFCLLFAASEALAQCGPTGTDPCKTTTANTPKKITPKKTTKIIKPKSTKPKPTPVKTEPDYSRTLTEVQQQFDLFIVELNKNPGMKGHIVNYGTEKQITEREKVIKYAAKKRKFDVSRLVIINGGNLGYESETKFFLVNPEDVNSTSGNTDMKIPPKVSVNPTEKNSPCPAIDMSGPSGITSPGETMTFTVNVSGGTMSDISYNWTVSAGEITDGQGTSSIMVDTKGLKSAVVTAEVEIGGLNPSYNCKNIASDSGTVQVVY